MRISKHTLVATLLAALASVASWSALAQPDFQEKVDALRQNLSYSKQQLMTYEWIETTVVTANGEQKARIQNQVYYGADGTLQKVPISSEKNEKKKRGIRGKVAENKMNEVKGFMRSAVGTVKLYVPPEPQRLQSLAQAGKVSFSPIEPGKRVRLDFQDYQKPGDVLGVELDIVNNRILGLNVKTYVNAPSDNVTMTSKFRTLNDGASYPAQVQLKAPTEGVTVDVANTGYRKQ